MSDMSRWVVVRRWRDGRSTLSLHRDGCPSVKRREVASYVLARSELHASVQASVFFMSEVTVGVGHWGTECRKCRS